MLVHYYHCTMLKFCEINHYTSGQHDLSQVDFVMTINLPYCQPGLPALHIYCRLRRSISRTIVSNSGPIHTWYSDNQINLCPYISIVMVKLHTNDVGVKKLKELIYSIN